MPVSLACLHICVPPPSLSSETDRSAEPSAPFLSQALSNAVIITGKTFLVRLPLLENIITFSVIARCAINCAPDSRALLLGASIHGHANQQKRSVGQHGAVDLRKSTRLD